MRAGTGGETERGGGFQGGQKGPQPGGQRKVFALLGDAEQPVSPHRVQPFHHFRHQMVGGGGPGGHSRHLHPGQPLLPDGVRRIHPVGGGVQQAGGAHQGPGVGRIVRPHHQNQVAFPAHFPHRPLPVGGGVAQVAFAGGEQIGKPVVRLPQHRLPFMHPQSGLGEQGHPFRIPGREVAQPPFRFHQSDGPGGFGYRPHRLIVPLVADEDDVVVAGGRLFYLVMHFGHQRAHRVDHHPRPPVGLLRHLRGGTVRGQHDRGSGRRLLRGVDKNHPRPFESFHHEPVVDDLVVAVDGGGENLHHPGQGFDGHVHPGAEAARLGQQHPLRAGPGGVRTGNRLRHTGQSYRADTPGGDMPGGRPSAVSPKCAGTFYNGGARRAPNCSLAEVGGVWNPPNR